MIIETSGAPQAARQAVEMAKKGAVIVFVGYSKTGEVTLPMSMALDKELTFRTVFRYRNIYPMAIRGRGQRRRQPQGHRHEFLRV